MRKILETILSSALTISLLTSPVYSQSHKSKNGNYSLPINCEKFENEPFKLGGEEEYFNVIKKNTKEGKWTVLEYDPKGLDTLYPTCKGKCGVDSYAVYDSDKIPKNIVIEWKPSDLTLKEEFEDVKNKIKIRGNKITENSETKKNLGGIDTFSLNYKKNYDSQDCNYFIFNHNNLIYQINYCATPYTKNRNSDLEIIKNIKFE